MHHGDVCTVGIFCSAVPGSNRDLLDFIDVQVDRRGQAHVVFTGDFGSSNGIYSANQVSGPKVGAPGPPPGSLGSSRPPTGPRSRPGRARPPASTRQAAPPVETRRG